MIIKCDGKQLEWRTYLELSRDPVGIQEINDQVDVHADNQGIFRLPERIIAKRFLFRWIYRGPAFSYANDTDFIPTSSSQAFWQDVIDAANNKYHVLYEYQNRLIHRASLGEVITIPSGREYVFEPHQKHHGGWEFSEPEITNIPNQGFAADIVAVARILARRKLRKYDPSRVKMINTVHDDIELDVDNDADLLYNISIDMEDSFKEVPEFYRKYFDYEFEVPIEGEIGYGENLYDLEEIKFNRDRGVEQFYDDRDSECK